MDDDLNQWNWRRGRDALSSGSANPVGPSSYSGVPGGPSRNMTFGIGNVLGTGFRVWIRNLAPFLLISAVLYAPPWLWALSEVPADYSPEHLRHAVMSLIYAAYLAVPIGVLVTATLTYGVVMELHGQRASVGACIATGLTRFFPALAVSIVSWICITLGVLGLLVGTIFVYCMLYVATPVSVVERPGVAASLSRSSELTKGHRWEIFGLVVILVFLSFLTNTVFNAVAGGLAQAISPGMHKYLLVRIGASYLHQVISGSVAAVMASVGYVFLRAEKDGTSTAELAAIFD